MLPTVTRTSLSRPPLLDTAAILGFLRARQAPAIETIENDAITRFVRVSGNVASFRVAIGASRIALESSLRRPIGRAEPAAIQPAVMRQMARRMLDLDADLE